MLGNGMKTSSQIAPLCRHVTGCRLQFTQLQLPYISGFCFPHKPFWLEGAYRRGAIFPPVSLLFHTGNSSAQMNRTARAYSLITIALFAAKLK